MEAAHAIGTILGYAIVGGLLYGVFKLISQIGKKQTSDDQES